MMHVKASYIGGVLCICADRNLPHIRADSRLSSKATFKNYGSVLHTVKAPLNREFSRKQSKKRKLVEQYLVAGFETSPQ
jgi:hypothetical protein